jgi:hypothetical protein
MLNDIIDSQKVRAQKVVSSSQSSRSSLVHRRSEDRLEIKILKESLRQRGKEMRWWDEAMRQRDGFYAQQQAILQVSWLNYFICYQVLSNTF